MKIYCQVEKNESCSFTWFILIACTQYSRLSLLFVSNLSGLRHARTMAGACGVSDEAEMNWNTARTLSSWEESISLQPNSHLSWIDSISKVRCKGIFLFYSGNEKDFRFRKDTMTLLQSFVIYRSKYFLFSIYVRSVEVIQGEILWLR